MRLHWAPLHDGGLKRQREGIIYHSVHKNSVMCDVSRVGEHDCAACTLLTTDEMLASPALSAHHLAEVRTSYDRLICLS